ncbi:MAG: hypothetical protein IT450_19545 [Phycisphaerales bacterium]|nr:hypothetical protein [Phycisphaerales bacterium]
MNDFPDHSRRPSALAISLLAIATVLLPSVVAADENLFLPEAGGYWSVPENWSFGHCPTGYERAAIFTGSNMDKVVTFDSAAASFDWLAVGGDGTTSFGARVIHQQGTLEVFSWYYLGVYGYGEHQLVGTARLQVGSIIVVGCQGGEFELYPGVGYFLLDTVLDENAGLTTFALDIGAWAPGLFDHRSGYVTAEYVELRRDGTYWFHPVDPSSRVRTATIYAEGDFLHESGRVETDNLRVSGPYQLSEPHGLPSQLIVQDTAEIGPGAATMEQNAGIADVTTLLIDGGGADPTVSANYSLNGGTLSVNTLTCKANGRLRLLGGLANITTWSNVAPHVITLDGAAECRSARVDNTGTLNVAGAAFLREATGGDPATGCYIHNWRDSTVNFGGGRFRGAISTDGVVNYYAGDLTQASLYGSVVRGRINVDGALECRNVGAGLLLVSARGSIRADSLEAMSLVLSTGASIDVPGSTVQTDNLGIRTDVGEQVTIAGNVDAGYATFWGEPIRSELAVHGRLNAFELSMRVGGTGADQHDRLTADAGVTIVGRTIISAAGGYAPTLGDVFVPITWNPGASAHFGEFELPPLPAGLLWDVQITDTGLRLEVIANEPCPGDVDFDLDIDLNDLARLLSHFGMTEGATLGDGDLTGDGAVDLADLAILLNEFGKGC